MATTAPPSTAAPQQATISTKQKAFWTTDNDRTLLGSLKDCKHAGFQTDNGGFHNDAYKAAAARLEEEWQDLLASERLGAPKNAENCKTRFATLKKDYKDAKYLRNLSGFGWDPLKHVVTATASVWAALFARTGTKYKKWQNKTFHFYDEMAELVDGHVATGATAFHPAAPTTTAPTPASAEVEADVDNEQTDDEEPASTPIHRSQLSLSPFEGVTMSSMLPAKSPQTPAPLSQVTNTTASATKRRRSAAPNSSERPAKRSHGRKPTQNDASLELADALRDLADSAKGDVPDPATRTPSRKSRAIQMLEDDGELSDHSMTMAFQLISRDVSIADTYLAIRDVSRRTRYLEAELSDISHS
ncbi:hypothetical protein K435DRAFT_972275 [Dendrothele bispora CBS 962.96]|uniref:Myb/SANT-like domain-containing protein n=1 Tax=Dendrothele bispora (strain CBS 962.96) TaxID=1314807 RepID=A0A4S8L0B1_DENBC|nr:hypothetical protein K435DRAFT_972275 [Dendrothele bispora CBS 962.96]